MFIEYRDLCESWYCMLVSRLLYQQPTVKAFDLQYHTQVGGVCKMSSDRQQSVGLLYWRLWICDLFPVNHFHIGNIMI